MLSVDEIYADIEADRLSRESEIRLVERLTIETKGEAERSMLRRSLVMLTYAHLEGFTKFVLLAYASSINSMKLDCSAAATPIAAASLSKVFAALRNSESKHDFFRRRMPDDVKLHLVAREHAFLAEFDAVLSRQVQIPDTLIDTKSNLSPDVLRKLLFLLGLPYSKVDEHQGTISRLLGVRNSIAHGDRLSVPSEAEVKEYLNSAVEVMSFLQSEIYFALTEKLYLRIQSC